MTSERLYRAIKTHFPQIEPNYALITAQNFATMQLVTAKALLAEMKQQEHEYAPLVTFIVSALESDAVEPQLEEELQPLWELHQIQDEYYHCCGGW